MNLYKGLIISRHAFFIIAIGLLGYVKYMQYDGNYDLELQQLLQKGSYVAMACILVVFGILYFLERKEGDE